MVTPTANRTASFENAVIKVPNESTRWVSLTDFSTVNRPWAFSTVPALALSSAHVSQRMAFECASALPERTWQCRFAARLLPLQLCRVANGIHVLPVVAPEQVLVRSGRRSHKAAPEPC